MKLTTAFETHNHKSCRDDILAQVEARASDEGLRLTDMRRRVLCILLESHEAMGAYDILNRLVAEGESAQPPLVYRALNFLTEHGFVHKVESQNAYIACQFPSQTHRPGLLICRNCKSVGECCVEKNVLQAQDFHIENETLEAQGLCNNCFEADHATD